MKFAINDVVHLAQPLAVEQLDVGAVGVIVEVFSEPEEAYEVEFTDEHGATTHQVLLRPGQIQRLG